MIKRTIEISREPAYLSCKLDQLLVQPADRDKHAAKSIPCEDIGLVMVDQPQTGFSHGALEALMRFGAAFVVCGRDHLPVGMMLPVSGNSEIVTRLNEQIAVTMPVKKRLWQQIVVAKIAAMVRHVSAHDVAARRLKQLGRTVKSGDPSNVEGQAGRVYWSAVRELAPVMRDFRLIRFLRR